MQRQLQDKPSGRHSGVLNKPLLGTALIFGVLVWPSLASADTITDPTGDFLSTYTGPQNGDLDVIGASVLYDPGTTDFTITATMNGAIGTTAAAAYVWGVNTGNGTAAFATSLNLPGVVFNKTFSLTAASPTAGGVGSVSVSGDTITFVVPLASLPAATNGLTPATYGWNLWPKDSAVSGLAGISDFAPNDSMMVATVVPEPSSAMLMALGLAGLVWMRRRPR